MLHVVDTATSGPPERAAWMALLARAPLPLLESALAAEAQAPVRWLRAPETGLMMVQGRAGGTGERFNLGEVTVTRCTLRRGEPAQAAQGPTVGVAYVLGRSHRQAQLAALADALLQDPAQHAVLEKRLLAPVRAHLAAQAAERQARAQSTKVDFMTVARESGGDDEEDAE